MATSISKRVVVAADGRVDVSFSALPPGTKAEITVRVESAEERLERAEALGRVFKQIQAEVAHLGLTEEDVAREIQAARVKLSCGS